MNPATSGAESLQSLSSVDITGDSSEHKTKAVRNDGPQCEHNRDNDLPEELLDVLEQDLEFDYPGLFSGSVTEPKSCTESVTKSDSKGRSEKAEAPSRKRKFDDARIGWVESIGSDNGSQPRLPQRARQDVGKAQGVHDANLRKPVQEARRSAPFGSVIAPEESRSHRHMQLRPQQRQNVRERRDKPPQRGRGSHDNNENYHYHARKRGLSSVGNAKESGFSNKRPVPFNARGPGRSYGSRSPDFGTTQGIAAPSSSDVNYLLDLAGPLLDTISFPQHMNLASLLSSQQNNFGIRNSTFPAPRSVFEMANLGQDLQRNLEVLLTNPELLQYIYNLNGTGNVGVASVGMGVGIGVGIGADTTMGGDSVGFLGAPMPTELEGIDAATISLLASLVASHPELFENINPDLYLAGSTITPLDIVALGPTPSLAAGGLLNPDLPSEGNTVFEAFFQRRASPTRTNADQPATPEETLTLRTYQDKNIVTTPISILSEETLTLRADQDKNIVTIQPNKILEMTRRTGNDEQLQTKKLARAGPRAIKIQPQGDSQSQLKKVQTLNPQDPLTSGKITTRPGPVNAIEPIRPQFQPKATASHPSPIPTPNTVITPESIFAALRSTAVNKL